MKYIITQSQARYIQEHYGFLQLLGLNTNVPVRHKVRDELLEKGAIYDNQGHDELHPAIRALFSCWERMRYSVARVDLNRDTRFQCLLTNRRNTMFFDRQEEEIHVDLIDFSEEKLDQLFAVLAELSGEEMSHIAGITQRQDGPVNESALDDCIRIIRAEHESGKIASDDDLLAYRNKLKESKGVRP